MRVLSFIIVGLIIFYIGLISASSNVSITKTVLESPHGKDLTISCDKCHSAKSWDLDTSVYSFDHTSTKMPLVGQHNQIDCKLCHTTLVFSDEKTKKECVDCHADIHSQTVGNFCENCHTSDSWIVTNISEIHQQSRFPLLGVHTMTECQKCHQSESLHQYNVLGVECQDCHQANYMATTRPNHLAANFDTECSRCHYIYAYEWQNTGFNHSFFSLTKGHDNLECSACHQNNNYLNTSPACVSCHLDDYNAATNPVHSGGCYTTNCTECHTTDPGWSPTTNSEHSFPITSGAHNGISCIECHTSPTDCSFSCIDCHEHNQSSMNNEHDDVGGYTWASNACYSCHPNGKH